MSYVVSHSKLEAIRVKYAELEKGYCAFRQNGKHKLSDYKNDAGARLAQLQDRRKSLDYKMTSSDAVSNVLIIDPSQSAQKRLLFRMFLLVRSPFAPLLQPYIDPTQYFLKQSIPNQSNFFNSDQNH